MSEPRPGTVLAIDVGSTTTKAVLIECRDGEYRLGARGETPTTVERPRENVMAGVRSALRRLEELTGRRLLAPDGTLLRPRRGDAGVDFCVSTSSAGGGLQLTVAGLVSTVSAASAHRAALGAGAVVLDVIAVDDGRSTSEQIARIAELRPDIILMSGGVDGGSVTHLAAIAETIVQASPQPRFGANYRLPLIYAGNRDAADLIQAVAGEAMDLHVVDNLRPRHDEENLGPARQAIHDLFLNHVMAQAPGYEELQGWVDAAVIPTPAAVGQIIAGMAGRYRTNIVALDIGGATTDVFSVFRDTFTRTVSANLGMSYSIGNVLEEAGFANICRWLPYAIDKRELADRVANKMVRPATLPETPDQLLLEQAVAREVMRLSFQHHCNLARKVERKEAGTGWGSQAKIFRAEGEKVVDLGQVGMLVGSGGVLSHAPRRSQAALMLLDSIQPVGVTQLAVDSVFLLPHLGVLSGTHPGIAAEVLERDGLVRLGTCIGPAGRGREGQTAVTVRLHSPGGGPTEAAVALGEVICLPLAAGQTGRVEIRPAAGFDVGAGRGRPLAGEVAGGLVGVIIDCRGRPLALPSDHRLRRSRLLDWMEQMQAFPPDLIREFRENADG